MRIKKVDPFIVYNRFIVYCLISDSDIEYAVVGDLSTQKIHIEHVRRSSLASGSDIDLYKIEDDKEWQNVMAFCVKQNLITSLENFMKYLIEKGVRKNVRNQK